MGREIERNLPQGVHQVYAHSLSLRVCRDLGRAKKISQELDAVNLQQGSSNQRCLNTKCYSSHGQGLAGNLVRQGTC